MTKKKEAGAKPRHYDECVQARGSAAVAEQRPAAELHGQGAGISGFNLYEGDVRDGLPGPAVPHVSKEELEAENERLRGALARITEQTS